MRKLTAYDAQRYGKVEYEAHKKEVDELRELLKAKDTVIEALTKKQKYKFWLKIKAASFDVTEEYLREFLTAVKPIAEVVQAEWGRY